MSNTKYVIVNNSQNLNESASGSNVEAAFVARLLDDGYTLVVSWVVDEKIHHILSKDGGEKL